MHNVFGISFAAKGENGTARIQRVRSNYFAQEHLLQEQGFSDGNASFGVFVAVEKSAKVECDNS